MKLLSANVAKSGLVPINRPHLRKCLWTLESDGFIENINLGMNIHQWKITEQGKLKLITNKQK